jgi:hypothetical protein
MAPAHPFFRYVWTDIRGGALPQHEAYGLHFILKHDVAPGASQQTAWRYCGKCRAFL